MNIKKKAFLILIFLASCVLFPASSFAQFTTVTATVTDPNGIPYAGGTMSAVLVPGASGGYRLSGQPYSGRVGPLTLDSTGSFTANFGDVTLITPGSPQWQITINSNPGGIPLPLGTGGQTFVYTSTGTTISGSSPVSLSVALTALAPKLTNFAGAGTGTIAGTVTAFHIPYASAANTLADIAGSAVTGATGAIALTAGADTTKPLQINSHSATQSANLLDINNQSGGSPSASLVVRGTGFGAFNPGNITSLMNIQQDSTAAAGDALIITNRQAVGSSSALSTLEFSMSNAGLAKISAGNAVGDSTGNYEGIQWDINAGISMVRGPTGTIGGVPLTIGSLNASQTGDMFDVKDSAGITSGFDNLGNLFFNGSTSGTAKIGVAAVAGTPCEILLPVTSPTVGQFLQSAAPSSGNCQTSWATAGSGTVTNIATTAPLGGGPITSTGTLTCTTCQTTGIGGASALLPFGTDTGGAANTYVVNPTPAVTLTQGTAFDFTAAHTNTGASTMNASGTGVKNLIQPQQGSVGSGSIISGNVYSATYDGTEWILGGYKNIPGGATNISAAQYVMVPSVNTDNGGLGAPLIIESGNPGPGGGRQPLLMFMAPGGGSYVNISVDTDNVLVVGGNMLWDFGSSFETSATFASAENTLFNGDDISVNASPGGPKTSGNAFSAKNNSGPYLWNVDSVTGLNTAAGRGGTKFVTTDFTDSTSGTLVAITGLSFTFPTLVAYNGSFHCSLTFQQLTAGVSDSFGIAATVTAPTQINANGVSFSGVAGAPTTGTLTGLTTTTPTAIVTFTPVATTLWPVELNGTVEVPSSATPSVVNFYVSTTTGTDNIVVKRGSYCSLM
jgi:hypothetical protein